MIKDIRPFITLCKPRILFLVTLTACVGFYLARQGIGSWSLFCLAMLGTSLCCAGAGVLNNYLERDVDKLMKRTCKRPIPAGQVAPADALIFGVILVLSGTALLVSKVNLLSGFLALLTAFLYVLVYTPLKRVTWLNTFVGAIPGAIPPLGGWAAATGDLSVGAWILFFILFLWQHPHFYAIAWMYKDDYTKGGFKMLPVVEPSGESTFRQIIIYSILLILCSILPTILGLAGYVYLFVSLLLGLFMLKVGLKLLGSHSVQDARYLLRASIIYLPIVLLLFVLDSV